MRRQLADCRASVLYCVRRLLDDECEGQKVEWWLKVLIDLESSHYGTNSPAAGNFQTA